MPKGGNKKVIGLIEYEFGQKIMTQFVALRANTYSYLTDGGNEDEKAKDTKKRVIKTKLKFENYKNCLEVTQLQNKIIHLEKNKTDIESIKELMKKNKSILKIQQTHPATRRRGDVVATSLCTSQ